MSAVTQERYRPRRIRSLGRTIANETALKLYGIEVEGAALGPVSIERAKYVLAAHAPGPGHVGFAILHRGEEAVWLLLHWWMAGGILAERLWRAPLGSAQAGFEPVDRPLMACVWELVPIAFERDAYVATVMNGGTEADYLSRELAEGWY
ncbi:hypothetical protein [Aureimonas sp. AU40]|uniref:hypothetical protein n=1 Tax=Aureimonas sp. AU40 TaxID=1637747 RepID=UPI00078185DB|nr:hypothetical protein [Aureimonas sp. AU40]